MAAGGNPDGVCGRLRIRREGIDGEPDRATATLADWQVYRKRLADLPQQDEEVRLAIAVADAQIAKLLRRR